MCDYSAEDVKSRKAVQGDLLVSGMISRHTRGFVGIGDRSTAVCLLPGTQLSFGQPVRVFSPGRKPNTFVPATLPHMVATFVQVDKDEPLTHHDALEFPDGEVVKLAFLVGGQQAKVVQLPVGDRAEHHDARAERTELRRVEHA